jgi:hypothetical protein
MDLGLLILIFLHVNQTPTGETKVDSSSLTFRQLSTGVQAVLASCRLLAASLAMCVSRLPSS